MSNTGSNGSHPKRALRDPQVIAAIITGILGLVGVLAGIIISNHSSALSQPNLSRSLSPSPAPPTSPNTIFPTPSSPSPSQKLNVTVACRIPPSVHSDERITATYTITSNQAVKVGLGAGVYDSGGADHSIGAGDQDGYQLTAGIHTAIRIIELPAGLSADQYEIDAEIWPDGKIGANGANVLAEATCGTFNVP
jgi:hypothetical protein